MDGVHVSGQACLCHVVLRYFKCRQSSAHHCEPGAQPKTLRHDNASPPRTHATHMAFTSPPILKSFDYAAATSKSAICHYPIRVRNSN